MSAPVIGSEVAGGAYLHFCADGDEVAPKALERMAAALDAAPDVDVAVASVVHGATYVGAHVGGDPLFELLAGGPYVAPAAAYLVRATVAERAWSQAPEPWGAREYFARLALRGARFVAVERAAVRTKVLRSEDDVAAAREAFARLRDAARESTLVRPDHRALLEQRWCGWRVGAATVRAGERTRALGAVGTVTGQEVARAMGTKTLEGWTSYVRAKVPRLERRIMAVREALEALAGDGLLIAEEG